MPTQEIKLDFEELRKLVFGTYEYGFSLRQSGGTFSHGNVGWDYIRLAERIDNLVADCEPGSKLTLVRDEMLEGLADDIVQLTNKYKDRMAEIRGLLGVEVNTDIKGKIDFLQKSLGRMSVYEVHLDRANDFRDAVKTILGRNEMNDDQALDQLSRLTKAASIAIQQPRKRKKK